MPTAIELARAYFDGLKEAYCREGGQEIWDHFASVAQGASQEDIEAAEFLSRRPREPA